MTRSRILFLAALAVMLGWMSLAIETFVFLGLADREKMAAGVQSIVENEAPYAEARAKGLSHLNPSEVREKVQKELDTALWWNAGVISLGTIAALAGLALPRYRIVAVLISSLVYWRFGFRYNFPIDVTLLDAYRLKWLAATMLNMKGTFFLKDVLLPLIFSVSVIACAATLVWTYRNRDR